MNKDQFMKLASDPKNWKKTHKKSYEIYVCKPYIGCKCYNFLEGTEYNTNIHNPFIMSGTVGENWTIGLPDLKASYMFADGTPITEETVASRCDATGQMDWVKIKTYPSWKNNKTLLAIQVPKEIHSIPVRDIWGNVLIANRPGVKHGLGDFLVSDGEGCIHVPRVVNGEVFPATYDLHAFPNMFNTADVKIATVPTKKFTERPRVNVLVDEITKGVVARLKELGHKIGEIMPDTMQLTSTCIDDKTYALLIKVTDNDRVEIGLFHIADRDWTEIASWSEGASYLKNSKLNGISNVALRIHNIIAGGDNKDELYKRAAAEFGGEDGRVYGDDAKTALKKADISGDTKRYAELVANAFRKVADKLNWKVSVEEVDADEAWWRVVIDKDGANGMWVVDFRCGSYGDAHFLEDFSEDVKSQDLDAKDSESVKTAITVMNNTFKAYM